MVRTGIFLGGYVPKDLHRWFSLRAQHENITVTTLLIRVLNEEMRRQYDAANEARAALKPKEKKNG